MNAEKKFLCTLNPIYISPVDILESTFLPLAFVNRYFHRTPVLHIQNIATSIVIWALNDEDIQLSLSYANSCQPISK